MLKSSWEVGREVASGYLYTFLSAIHGELLPFGVDKISNVTKEYMLNSRGVVSLVAL